MSNVTESLALLTSTAQDIQDAVEEKNLSYGGLSTVGNTIRSIPDPAIYATKEELNNIDVGVTSFNGNTGAVTYSAPVTSVNGMTGAVTVASGSGRGVCRDGSPVTVSATSWTAPGNGILYAEASSTSSQGVDCYLYINNTLIREVETTRVTSEDVGGEATDIQYTYYWSFPLPTVSGEVINLRTRKTTNDNYNLTIGGLFYKLKTV